MPLRKYKCPHKCGAEVGIDSEEWDSVECTCDCGGEFTAGEARRGHLYVKEQAEESRIADLERRVAELERRLIRSVAA